MGLIPRNLLDTVRKDFPFLPPDGTVLWYSDEGGMSVIARRTFFSVWADDKEYKVPDVNLHIVLHRSEKKGP